MTRDGDDRCMMKRLPVWLGSTELDWDGSDWFGHAIELDWPMMDCRRMFLGSWHLTPCSALTFCSESPFSFARVCSRQSSLCLCFGIEIFLWGRSASIQESRVYPWWSATFFEAFWSIDCLLDDGNEVESTWGSWAFRFGTSWFILLSVIDCGKCTVSLLGNFTSNLSSAICSPRETTFKANFCTGECCAGSFFSEVSGFSASCQCWSSSSLLNTSVSALWPISSDSFSNRSCWSCSESSMSPSSCCWFCGLQFPDSEQVMIGGLLLFAFLKACSDGPETCRASFCCCRPRTKASLSSSSLRLETKTASPRTGCPVARLQNAFICTERPIFHLQLSLVTQLLYKQSCWASLWVWAHTLGMVKHIGIWWHY